MAAGLRTAPAPAPGDVAALFPRPAGPLVPGRPAPGARPARTARPVRGAPGGRTEAVPSSAPGGRALAHTAKEPWTRWAGGPADPAATGGEDRTAASGDRAGQRRTVPLPLPRPPGGDPSGLLGERSLVDNGGPRHADPHAVAVRQRALPRLAPGALAKHPAEDVRYRSGEVPSPPGRDLREAARQRPRPPVPGPVRVRPPCGAVRGSAPSSS